MERQEILEQLKGILRGEQFLFLHEQIDEITEDTSLLSDLVMDSIQILELLVTVEEEFAIRCESEELSVDLFDKVSRLIDFIQKKVG